VSSAVSCYASVKSHGALISQPDTCPYAALTSLPPLSCLPLGTYSPSGPLFFHGRKTTRSGCSRMTFSNVAAPAKRARCGQRLRQLLRRNLGPFNRFLLGRQQAWLPVDGAQHNVTNLSRRSSSFQCPRLESALSNGPTFIETWKTCLGLTPILPSRSVAWFGIGDEEMPAEYLDRMAVPVVLSICQTDGAVVTLHTKAGATWLRRKFWKDNQIRRPRVPLFSRLDMAEDSTDPRSPDGKTTAGIGKSKLTTRGSRA